MKKLTCLPLLLLFLLVACRKKEETCIIHAHKVPCYIAFYGFRPADLDTIIRLRYERGSGFTRLLATDTLLFPNIYYASDSTIFSSFSRSNMGTLEANSDYDVSIPALSRTYRISNIVYQVDTVASYTTRDGCGSFAANSVYPETVTIDGSLTTTSTLATTNSSKWIVLNR